MYFLVKIKIKMCKNKIVNIIKIIYMYINIITILIIII